MNNVTLLSDFDVNGTVLELDSLLASEKDNVVMSQQEIDKCYQEYSKMEALKNYSDCN